MPVRAMTRLSRALTIDDLRELARRRSPKMFFDYMESGSWSEQTFRENVIDFARIRLRQRVAVNIDGRSLATTIAGQASAMPVALAPIGLAGMQIADGEILAARAAKKAGVPFTLSTMSICSIEDIAANTSRPFWFQLYVMRDRGFVERLIDRAKAANCSALVLTVDLQMLGQRHKDLRNGLSMPPRFTPKHVWQIATRPRWALGMLQTSRHTFGNIAGHATNDRDIGSVVAWTNSQFDPTLSWSDVTWVKKRFGGKVIVKGVLEVEDARSAVAAGADAIVVSNHGGRQLDGAPSSISVLPEIVDAVGDRTEVLFDSGIRSGQSVLKALALGARAVFIGRAFAYGLAAGGEAGVTRALEIIERELDLTMAFCGARQITEVGRHNLRPLPMPGLGQDFPA